MFYTGEGMYYWANFLWSEIEMFTCVNYVNIEMVFLSLPRYLEKMECHFLSLQTPLKFRDHIFKLKM